MKLGDWLKKYKKTQTWFAKQMKTDQGHVSEWVNGKVMPSMKMVIRIEKVTKSAVSFHDWAKS